MHPAPIQLAQLLAILGDRGVLHGEGVEARYHEDVVGTLAPKPAFIARPATTDEVSRLLTLCHEIGQPVVTQGGRTGLVQGALPQAGELVLSLERMQAIEQVNPTNGTMVAQAGCTLQRIQEAAEAVGRCFPLDLGARGSCTLGGVLATNAGGNRVLRYGMARDLTLGIEAVLADGTRIDGLHGLVKNNTGYDLRHLLIGSEGTLGVITRAVLRLHPQPRSQAVAFCALADFAAVGAVFETLRGRFAGSLSAFELMWRSFYDQVARLPWATRLPLAVGHPFYLLVETQGDEPERDGEALEQALMGLMDQGLIRDATIAHSPSDCARLWQLRDASLDITRLLAPALTYDIGLPLDRIEAFVSALNDALAINPEREALVLFGHLGDGNIHVLLSTDGDPTQRETINHHLYRLTGEYGGTVSAEHGIGMQKRPYLGLCRSPAELATMQRLKQALDPRQILNPGRIFATTAGPLP